MLSLFWSLFLSLSLSLSFKGMGMDLYLHLLLHWLEATTLAPPGSTSGSYGKPAALLDNYQRHVLANLSPFFFAHSCTSWAIN